MNENSDLSESHLKSTEYQLLNLFRRPQNVSLMQNYRFLSDFVKLFSFSTEVKGIIPELTNNGDTYHIPCGDKICGDNYIGESKPS